MLSKNASILNVYTNDPGFVFLKPHRVKGVCVCTQNPSHIHITTLRVVISG